MAQQSVDANGNIKITLSNNDPCRICGKGDWCYRKIFPNGELVHRCARVQTDSIFSGGEELVFQCQVESPIGTYYQYKEASLIKKRGASTTKNYIPKESRYVGFSQKGSDELLDRVNRRFLSLLVLEDKDLRTLKADWDKPSCGELSKAILANHMIKSFPPADKYRGLQYSEPLRNMKRAEIGKILYDEFGEDIYKVPGFYEEAEGVPSFVGKEGIAFPIYSPSIDSMGNLKLLLTYIRIRESYPDIKGSYDGKEGTYHHSYSKVGSPYWTFLPDGVTDYKESIFVWSPVKGKQKIQLKGNGCPAGKAQSKYKNFSSVYEKISNEGDVRVVTNGYYKGCRSDSNISLYCHNTDNFSTVYFTEGEKKAMVANELLGVPVVSLPGVGTFSKLFEPKFDGKSITEILVSKGMKLCVIAYDADKEENARVLKAEQQAVTKFIENGLQIAIAEWNGHFGKGLDDTLVQGVRPSLILCR